MSDDRTVKNVFLVKADGRRKAGRPKRRWLHSIENYLKSSGFMKKGNTAEGRTA
jgi:hypothetical protein